MYHDWRYHQSADEQKKERRPENKRRAAQRRYSVLRWYDRRRRSGWYRTGNYGSIHNRSFQSPERLQPGCHRQHRCTGSDHSDTVEILPLG